MLKVESIAGEDVEVESEMKERKEQKLRKSLDTRFQTFHPRNPEDTLTRADSTW